MKEEVPEEEILEEEEVYDDYYDDYDPDFEMYSIFGAMSMNQVVDMY